MTRRDRQLLGVGKPVLTRSDRHKCEGLTRADLRRLIMHLGWMRAYMPDSRGACVRKIDDAIEVAEGLLHVWLRNGEG